MKIQDVTLTPAVMEELDTYMELLDASRAFQRAQGFVQWPDGYPGQELIRRDIRTGQGYALRVDGRVAGYLVIGFDGDPAYPAIRGAWHFDRPYAVIHRMAIHPAFRGRGLAQEAFRLIGRVVAERDVDILRIDTDEKNARMRHVLERAGFSYCGLVIQGGGDRFAYDKALTWEMGR